MKTSRLVGLLVLAGIAIGAILSAVLPDFSIPGLGKGGGLGNPTSEKSDTLKSDALKATVTDPAAGPATETSAETETTTPAEVALPPAAVVYVVIDGREYLLRRGPEGKAAFKPATLDEVVEAAQAATGDDNGIRVRIEQKRSSRETTERTLRTKLSEVGIPSDSIRWKDEPIDGE